MLALLVDVLPHKAFRSPVKHDRSRENVSNRSCLASKGSKLNFKCPTKKDLTALNVAALYSKVSSGENPVAGTH